MKLNIQVNVFRSSLSIASKDTSADNLVADQKLLRVWFKGVSSTVFFTVVRIVSSPARLVGPTLEVALWSWHGGILGGPF